MDGQFGVGGGPGSIWRIDGRTGIGALEDVDVRRCPARHHLVTDLERIGEIEVVGDVGLKLGAGDAQAGDEAGEVFGLAERTLGNFR